MLLPFLVSLKLNGACMRWDSGREPSARRLFWQTRRLPGSQVQSGMLGSSPQIAEPAAFALPVPARFAAEKGELTVALSVER